MVNLNETPATASDRAAPAVEFLTFKLGGEEFGIDMRSVQELRGYADMVPLAGMPHFVKGQIALRGHHVVVIDLRSRFELPARQYDDFTVLVVLQGGGRSMGVLVDRVTDVVALRSEQIKPLVPLGSSIAVNYMLGIGLPGERNLILIDGASFMLGCAADMPGGGSAQGAQN